MKTAKGLSEGRWPDAAAESLVQPPQGLCCPRCRCLVNTEDAAAHLGRLIPCAGCGKTMVIRAGRIPDFLVGENPSVAAILGWSEGFVQNVGPWLLALASGKSVSADTAAELEVQQLVETQSPKSGERSGLKNWRCDPGSRLTALGNNLAYHCAEFSHQAARGDVGAFLERFLRLPAQPPGATVLDVGCGAGQTLRLVEAYHPAERIGLDIDLEALAFGCRLATRAGSRIHFVRASAYQIPFRDHRFTHVICRVSLNYMHQRRALAEMVRVLQPGGYLYCSIEGPGYDLYFLRQAGTATQLFSQLRDAFYGFMLAWTGAQPVPGSRLTGGRASGTIRQCTRAFADAGCEVISAETASRYLGLPLAFDVVARRC